MPKYITLIILLIDLAIIGMLIYLDWKIALCVLYIHYKNITWESMRIDKLEKKV